MKPVIKWTALALAVCLPLSAQAHRAWMLPSATVLSGEEPWITVDAAVSNDLFYFEHFPLQIEGVGTKTDSSRPGANLAVIRPDGSQAKPQNGNIGRYRSNFDVQLDQKGTWKLAIVNQGLFARFEQDGKMQRWSGKADDFAKQVDPKADKLQVSETASRMEVFVTSGNPTNEVLKPTQQGLELVPETHPNDLVAGEAAVFQFLLDGKPVADLDVSVVPGGNRYRDQLNDLSLKTDAQGKISIEWQTPGMHWLEASTETKPVLKDSPAKTRRASYSATFEVLAP